MTRGAAGVLAVVLAIAAIAGCSKSEESKPTHVYTIGPKPTPQLVTGEAFVERDAAVILTRDLPSVPTRAAGAAGSPASAPRSSPPPAASSSAASSARPTSNPDDPILAQARVACGQCFASLATTVGAPDRTAHVSFTVVSTGTVSRADVSSDDTSEPAVLDCLQQTAQATHFTDNGGGPLRTYAIDVRVHAGPPPGGR